MFYFRLDKIAAAQKGSSGIVFELTVHNRAPRSATILSYDFQLWLLRDMNAAEVEFLAPLCPDFYAAQDFSWKFGPQDQKPFQLTWHYTPRRLQLVEDWRKGGKPVFEIRGRLSVVSVWPGQGNTPQAPSFDGEQFYFAAGAQGGGYPIRFSVPQSDWTALLEQVGFRHITLYELPLPPFPPGFSRSESYLKEGWEHHWAGRRDEALLACRKAFEALGYNLFGDDKIARHELLERLMPDAEALKKDTLVKFWESLQNLFSNIGVHERGKPVELTHADTEMALVCATSLLGYFAKQK